MIELLGNKVAVIPIEDPTTLDANAPLSQRELDHAGVSRSNLKRNQKIIVPHEAKERTDQGIVKYVGPKCKYVKVTDYVIYSGYSGALANIEGEGRLIILEEDFLFAVLDEIPYTLIPGLYFRGNNGEYFEASYEVAMNLLAHGIHDAKWHTYDHATKQGLNIKTPKLRPEEYDRVRAD